MLRIVDRYLLRELAGPFGFGIVLFAALMLGTILLSDVLRTLQRYDLSFLLILKYLALSAPQFLVLCIPMGALLGTLISVGRMNSDHEVVALRAAGLDLYRVLLPYVVVGGFLAGVTLLGNELVVPRSRSALVRMKNDLFSGKFGGVQERVTIPITEGRELRWLLVAESMRGSELHNVVLLYFDPHSRQNDLLIEAADGHWQGGHWDFKNLRLSQLGGSSGSQLGRLETSEMQMPDFDVSPQELRTKRLSADDVSARQLRKFIQQQIEHQNTVKIDPSSVEALRDLHDQIFEEAAPQAGAQRTILPYYDHGELVWTLIADKVESGELHNVRLFHFDSIDRQDNYAAYATKAVWRGRQGWLFYDLRKVLIDPQDEEEPLISLQRQGTIGEFRLSPQDLQLRSQAIEDLNAAQLQRRIAELRISGDPADKRELRSLKTDLYFKYAIPLTPVFFVWIAFPLAIMPQRSSSTRGMGIALLIILVYMASVALFRSMGAAGVVTPLLAAWIPNIVLGFAGWRLMQQRQRS